MENVSGQRSGPDCWLLWTSDFETRQRAHYAGRGNPVPEWGASEIDWQWWYRRTEQDELNRKRAAQFKARARWFE